MSPAARKKKTARKVAAKKKTRVAAKKAATKRAAPKSRGAVRKTAAKKATKKSAKVKTTAAKRAQPAKKVAAKKPPPAAVVKRPASVIPAKASPAKAAPSRPAPAPLTTPRVEARPQRRPAPRRARPSHHDGATPDVARQHFRELLEAKQARVRQGPSYPAANAHTGQHPTTPVPLPAYVAAPPPATGSGAPEPAADIEPEHARGNQGMRDQK